ncbi:MAG: DUF72 domain-containing protein [Pseudomonas sp.]|uniref:DUF72 domain-containing protein n=1 Tax=Pseudomonas sp. TaxID=306 RepID=UPI003D6E81F7
MAAIHIGISGWRYTPWRGDFYPKGLPQKRELQFASRAVNSIEINGSFYALQRPDRYARWYAETPPHFIFSVKAPRFITHIKRLRDIHKPLANFFASGVLELKEKLGPILWQFPPNFTFDAELFEIFLDQLPHDTEQAAALAHQHDSHLIAPRQKLSARKSREVFCYFDNDIKVRAPFDARRLLERFDLDRNLLTAPGEPVAEGALS